MILRIIWLDFFFFFFVKTSFIVCFRFNLHQNHTKKHRAKRDNKVTFPPTGTMFFGSTPTGHCYNTFSTGRGKKPGLYPVWSLRIECDLFHNYRIHLTIEAARFDIKFGKFHGYLLKIFSFAFFFFPNPNFSWWHIVSMFGNEGFIGFFVIMHLLPRFLNVHIVSQIEDKLKVIVVFFEGIKIFLHFAKIT